MVPRILARSMDTSTFALVLFDDADSPRSREFPEEAVGNCSPLAPEIRSVLAQHVRHEGRPLLATAADARRIMTGANLETATAPPAVWLGIPVRGADGVIGVMSVHSMDDPEHFDLSVLESLAVYSVLIAMVIDKKRAEQVLMASEERLRLAQHIAHIGDWSWEVHSGKVVWSDEVFEIFDAPHKEPSVDLASQFIHPDDLEHWQTELRRAVDTQQPLSLDYRVVRTDGTVIWVHSEAAAILDEEGRFIGYRGTVQDVTEQKRVEEALRESEQKFRAMVESIGIGVSMISPDMKILELNRQMREWFPYVDPGQRPLCYQAFNNPPRQDICDYCPTCKTLRDGAVHESTKSIPLGDSVRDYRIMSTPIHDRRGKVVSAIELVEDITERKHAEDTLSQTVRRYSAMLDTVPAAVYLIDVRHRYVAVNQAFSALIGRPAAEIVGSEDETVLPAAWVATLRDRDNQVMMGGAELTRDEEQLPGAENDKRFYASITRPMFDEEQHIVGAVGMSQDVTEAHLRRMQLQQSEKLAAIGTLAAGVAHEINNPIGYVTSNLHTMSKYLTAVSKHITECSSASPEAAAEIGTILSDFADAVVESLEGTERVKKIVTDLKGFSRADRIRTEPFDVNDGIESTLNIVWNELKYHCRVEKELGDIPDVVCNAGQINQVLMNLLINAGQATEGKEGLITIKSWADRTHVHVSISDNGCGISEANQKRLFEPFFTTKPVGKGTGLGLSLAYDIMLAHRGTIAVQSIEGVGTEFTLSLPQQQD